MITPEIQKNIWDEKQIKRIEGGYTANKRRLDKIVLGIARLSGGNSAGVRVLNVGIGNGYLETELPKNGYEVYSLDPSDNAVQALIDLRGFPADRAVAGSAADMPFEDSYFDFIVMSEVLEHLDDATLHGALAEIRRTLKPGGHFLGTTPDNEDLDSNSFTCPHCGERSHRVGHVHSFTPAKLSEILSGYLTVRKCVGFRGMYLNWKGLLLHQWNYLPFKIARLIKPNIRTPHQIQFNIYFDAQKPHG